MRKTSIFQEFYSEERFVDRLEEKGEDGVDVIIPLLNTIELWEKNLYSFYREIPINRLLIGDGGCTDDSIDIVREFPRVEILDQTTYYSQGYCLRELIENVKTDWFVYLHADVYLPAGWYDEMVKHQNRYDWFECKRHFLYMLYDTSDVQFHADRAYSGSQMGKKDAFADILGQIDDDYIRRTEDIFFQQKIMERGSRYGKVSTAYHIHEMMNRKGELEPKFASVQVVRELDNEWLLKIAEEQFRATVKYLSPQIRDNVKMAAINMEYVLGEGRITYSELIKWVKQTNPLWVSSLTKYHRISIALRPLLKLSRYFYKRYFKGWFVFSER